MIIIFSFCEVRVVAIIQIFMNGAAYILYGGTAALMCGAYYFGKIMWKSDMNKAKEEILQHQSKNFEMLDGKFGLLDEKSNCSIQKLIWHKIQ